MFEVILTYVLVSHLVQKIFGSSQITRLHIAPPLGASLQVSEGVESIVIVSDMPLPVGVARADQLFRFIEIEVDGSVQSDMVFAVSGRLGNC